MKTFKKICSLSVKFDAAVFTIITTLLSFFSIEGWNLSNCCKIFILVAICILIFILSTICIFISKKRKIWSKNSGSIIVRYGDLLKIAFKKNNCCKSKDKKFVVIPVNTHFDVIVQAPGEVPHPLVSDRTLHGKWLKKYFEYYKETPERLQNEIYKRLDDLGVQPNVDNEHTGGHRKYPIGTCVIINGNDSVKYILIAISEFNADNNATSTKNNIILSVKSLINFVYSQGQGYKCYVPLMGTGLSKSGLDYKQSLHTILSTMELYNDDIYSSFNVVIYKGNRLEVSIYDY